MPAKAWPPYWPVKINSNAAVRIWLLPLSAASQLGVSVLDNSNQRANKGEYDGNGTRAKTLQYPQREPSASYQG